MGECDGGEGKKGRWRGGGGGRVEGGYGEEGGGCRRGEKGVEQCNQKYPSPGTNPKNS